MRSFMTAVILALALVGYGDAAPLVEITDPLDGATYSHRLFHYIGVVAHASGFVSIRRIEFFEDSVFFCAVELPDVGLGDTSAVCAVRTNPNGSSEFTARAVDWSGDAAESAPVTVFWNNIPPPKLPKP